MKLEGIHHITCITGDAPGNVDFYVARARAAAGQEDRQPGRPDRLPPVLRGREGRAPARTSPSSSTRARAAGRAGAGMVHRIAWRVASDEALDFWEERLGAEGVETTRDDGSLRFADPEGLGLELRVVETADAPLIAEHPEIPAEHALQGFDGVARLRRRPRREPRAPRGDARASSRRGDERVGGARRQARAAGTPTIPLPRSRGIGGAGTVHHVAWASPIGRARGLAAARPPQAGGRPDAGDRPLLLQVDLLPRAERRAVRDRHARPGLHRRRAARDASARGSRCRPTSSTCATGSSTSSPRCPTRARPRGRARGRPGRAGEPAGASSSSTAAAPTSTTSSRCSTSSTRSGGFSA